MAPARDIVQVPGVDGKLVPGFRLTQTESDASWLRLVEEPGQEQEERFIGVSGNRLALSGWGWDLLPPGLDPAMDIWGSEPDRGEWVQDLWAWLLGDDLSLLMQPDMDWMSWALGFWTDDPLDVWTWGEKQGPLFDLEWLGGKKPLVLMLELPTLDGAAESGERSELDPSRSSRGGVFDTIRITYADVAGVLLLVGGLVVLVVLWESTGPGVGVLSMTLGVVVLLFGRLL